MGCTKGCLDYLKIEVSLPWLYGGTGHAFVLNMNDTVFVDGAHAWDTASLYRCYPNLGFERQGLVHNPGMGDGASPELFRQKQREAWDFVRACIDRGIPCYGWELAQVPMYYVIVGYDDVGYYYSSGWKDGGPCPWEQMGTFDVRMVAVHAIRPCPAAADDVVVRDALNLVLERVERPDGWAIGPRYRTGLAGYELWAEALESGRAILDGHSYINHLWLECREMAVEFLREAKLRLPGRCDAAFDEAAVHYGVVRDRLGALLAMHPERPEREADWTTTFQSTAGAGLVREAAQAERQGVACLRRIVSAL
jgi:hypothetical protein